MFKLVIFEKVFGEATSFGTLVKTGILTSSIQKKEKEKYTQKQNKIFTKSTQKNGSYSKHFNIFCQILKFKCEKM